MYVYYRERERFKELVHRTRKLASPKSIRVVSPASWRPREELPFNSEGSAVTISSSSREVILSIKALTEWIRPTHKKGNIIYSESTDLNVNLI